MKKIFSKLRHDRQWANLVKEVSLEWIQRRTIKFKYSEKHLIIMLGNSSDKTIRSKIKL